jgi:hypothetical protein
LKAIVHQPQYFPYPGFFHKLSLGDVFVIMDNTQYDKRFTNRNQISSTSGSIWLSVPINKKHKFLLNNQVQINNEISWNDEHYKKIFHAYNRSPYFSIYKEDFQRIYEKTWDYLIDLNIETLKQTLRWLGIKIEIIRESDLGISSTSTQRLIDCCKAVGADTYVSGPGAKEYLENELFNSQKINLEFQKYLPIKYKQFSSENFIPNLSIIDMLCNLGPKTLPFLTKHNN